MQLIQQYMPVLTLIARVVELIVVCGSFAGAGWTLTKWAIKNAKNSDDIPKLREEVENFTKIIRQEIEALKVVVMKSDGSTIADHTDLLQQEIEVEKKNGGQSPSYIPNPFLNSRRRAI